MVRTPGEDSRPILLSKDTESEGIIITSGSCDLADPSFSNAAERLAGLEIDVHEAPSPRSSPASARSRSRASPSATGSSRSLRTNSTRSLASITENATSYKSGNDVAYELEPLDSDHVKSGDLGVNSNVEELKYVSPFGCPDAQQELPDRNESFEAAEGNSNRPSWGSYEPTDERSVSGRGEQSKNGA